MNVRIVGIHFAAALVHGQEYGLDTGGGLSHQAGGAGRGDGQTGNVAASVLLHLLVHFRVGFTQAVDERVVLFAFCVVHLECAALFGHFYGGAIGVECHRLVYFLRELGCLFSTVTQSQGGKHVAFCRDTYTGTAALGAFLVNLLPQNAFCMFHVFTFGVGIYLAHDALYLLQFKVDDIVHDALGQSYMLLE